MIWYPYTQMKTMDVPHKIVNAKGVYLYTEEKNSLIPFLPGGVPSTDIVIRS